MARLVEVTEKQSPKLVEVKSAPVDLQESNAAYRSGKEAPGALQGFLSASQGPTFGFADELIGSLGAMSKGALQMASGKGAPSSSDMQANYKDLRDFVRGASDKQSQENPWTTAITRGMASAPTMLIGGAPARAAGMVRNTLMAGRNGAISGGLSGLGNSAADTFTDDLLNTGVGAAGGFALGAAAVPVAAGMGRMKDNVVSRFSDSAAMQYAKNKVAEAFARDARGAAVQSNPSTIIPQATARLGKLGEEARVVDTGGQNTRQLLDTVATLPGQSKQAVEAAIRSRQAGRADRLIGAAESSLGTNGDRAAQVVSQLVQTRQAAATPLYGRLHQMEVQATPELAGILNAAEQLGAGKVARDISTAAQLPYSLSQKEWASSGGRLSMRDLDHMKQGLDTLIAKQTDPSGKVSPLGYRLQGLRERMLGELDGATQGFYKQARDAFAGPSALIDATSAGRRFMTAEDAATRQAMAGLSTSEQEAFRLGAFEALRNKLGRPGGQTEVLGMWKDKILREKLQAIFPDERAFRQFAATASAEAQMKGMETVGRGSQTAARQAGAGDLDVSAVGDVLHGMNNPAAIPGMLSTLAKKWNQVQTPEPVRDAMGQILLQQGRGAQNALMDLQEAARIVAMRRNRNANALGIASGSAAAPLTNALILPR